MSAASRTHRPPTARRRDVDGRPPQARGSRPRISAESSAPVRPYAVERNRRARRTGRDARRRSRRSALGGNSAQSTSPASTRSNRQNDGRPRQLPAWPWRDRPACSRDRSSGCPPIRERQPGPARPPGGAASIYAMVNDQPPSPCRSPGSRVPRTHLCRIERDVQDRRARAQPRSAASSAADGPVAPAEMLDGGPAAPAGGRELCQIDLARVDVLESAEMTAGPTAPEGRPAREAPPDTRIGRDGSNRRRHGAPTARLT